MAVKTNKEITSFKLLEEEPSDETPTAHMKKVVGLVLEKTDLKDQDVTNSFRNLMEYREAPPSPSASSVTTSISTLDPDGLGSPTTPSSPVPQPVDDERLPNELLDEICEDIGMKEGMELDFVEFLMEQDMPDPQSYMTPEAILNSSSLSTGSQASIILAKPSSMGGSTPRPSGFETSLGKTTSPMIGSSATSGTSTVVSSGANSPASKRFHLSTSGEASPTTPTMPHSVLTSGSQVFKMPQTPPTPKRPSSASLGVQSPTVQSSTSSTSVQTCLTPNSKQRCYSPKPNLPSCSVQGSSPCQKQQTSIQQSPCAGMNNQPGTLHYGQSHQIAASRLSCPSVQKQTHVNFQRLCKPAPPVVNVQNMQQPHHRLMNPKHAQTNIHGCVQDSMAMHSNPQFARSMESPLDQGYFSSDAASVRSYGSSTSSALTVSSMANMDPLSSKSADMLSMIPSIQQSNSVQPQHRVVTVGHVQMGEVSTIQKSVHFADMPGSDAGSDCQQNVDVQSFNTGFNAASSDCSFDIDQEFRENSQKSKILPRLTPSMKSEVAPYTVPCNNPYDFSNRSSCGMTQSNRPGSGGSPAVNMQQLDFSGKGQDNGMYFMDNNQNMMRVDSGEFSQLGYQQSQNNYTGQMTLQQMNAYRGMTDSMKASTMAQMQQLQNEMYRNHGMMQQSGNYSNSCSVAAVNQGGNRVMTGNQQMAQSYGQQQQQQQQTTQVSQAYTPQQMQNTCSTPRMASASSQMAGGYGSMGPSGFDQGMYNAGNRTPAGGNMNSQMYQTPQQQTANLVSSAGTPQGWAGTNPQTTQNVQDLSHVHMKQTPVSAMQPLMQPGTPQVSQSCAQGMQPGAASPVVPCTQPNCHSCKTGSPHRPPMLASQQTFIQHLITDRSNAFRSHPLFPLLRDLIIADMNFSSPSFPYQLISNLPAEFEKLLQNFLHRNPPSGNYQGNYAVESVIMDALRYAHQCLIEKIRVRQEQDKHTKATSKSLSAIEEFCEKFDRAVRNSMPEPSASGNHGNPMMMTSGQMGGSSMSAGPMGSLAVGQGVKDPKYGIMDPNMSQGGFMGKGIGLPSLASPQFRSIKDAQDIMSDAGSAISNSSNHSNKSESKKHPSLPKEAVAMMLDWLRNHKDNPYPNDDEKAMLIKQTGLTINQINYWFTNARRRILPKWAQCK